MNAERKETRKYILIAQQLKHDILSGKYKAGENFPAVRKLALMYKVTPLTISKATSYLSSLGYLIIRQGSGAKVVIPEKDNKKNTIALMVNKERKNLDLPINCSYNEIFLEYMMLLDNKNYHSNIISYQRDEKGVPVDFFDKIKTTDAVIILGTLPECYYNFFENKDIPIVIFERNIPAEYKSRIGSVDINMSKLEEAINYLTSLGHFKILYSIDREIFLDAVFKKRLSIIKNYIESSPQKSDFELEIFQFSLDSPESRDNLKAFMDKGFKAAICYNDISALNLYKLVNLIKKNIPQDFSVIGIDDILPSRLAAPPLTTIKIDRSKLILKAVSVLERLLEDPAQKKIIDDIDAEFIIRESAYMNN